MLSLLRISIALLCCGIAITQAEPENINRIKQDLIKYHNSGAYLKEIKTVSNKAHKFIAQAIASNNASPAPKKLALILDIDETALSNYATIVKLDFGGKLTTIEKFMHQAQDPAIQPILKLYSYAKSNHVAVFFVTGRPEHERALTILNLTRAGYKDWNGIFLKPETYHQASIVPYKSSIRQNITARGYNIIANIGDQFSDLQGGHALKTFKLPDPFYYIA